MVQHLMETHERTLSMAHQDSPIGAIGKQKEEGYFQQRDAELIANMRARLTAESTAEDLKAQTGVEDDALLVDLAHHGITLDTVPVLHLMPLIEVAWADGEIQTLERDLIMDAAAQKGITEGPAFEFLTHLLSARPDQTLVTAALKFLAHLVAALPDAEGTAARDNLLELTWRVADACGGVFGLWGRVEDEEKDALKKIVDVFNQSKPDASDGLLKKL